MKRKLKDFSQILVLLCRVLCLRVKIRRFDRRNSILRARIEQLDHDVRQVHNPQSNPPLVSIGSGGDYTQKFYEADMN